MNTIIEVLNNSALMGLIGVVIGGSFSVIGVVSQSKFNNKQFERNRIEYILNEKKLAYLDFLILNQKIFTFQYFFHF